MMNFKKFGGGFAFAYVCVFVLVSCAASIAAVARLESYEFIRMCWRAVFGVGVAAALGAFLILYSTARRRMTLEELEGWESLRRLGVTVGPVPKGAIGTYQTLLCFEPFARALTDFEEWREGRARNNPYQLWVLLQEVRSVSFLADHDGNLGLFVVFQNTENKEEATLFVNYEHNQTRNMGGWVKEKYCYRFNNGNPWKDEDEQCYEEKTEEGWRLNVAALLASTQAILIYDFVLPYVEDLKGVLRAYLPSKDLFLMSDQVKLYGGMTDQRSYSPSLTDRPALDFDLGFLDLESEMRVFVALDAFTCDGGVAFFPRKPGFDARDEKDLFAHLKPAPLFILHHGGHIENYLDKSGRPSIRFQIEALMYKADPKAGMAAFEGLKKEVEARNDALASFHFGGGGGLSGEFMVFVSADFSGLIPGLSWDKESYRPNAPWVRELREHIAFLWRARNSFADQAKG